MSENACRNTAETETGELSLPALVENSPDLRDQWNRCLNGYAGSTPIQRQDLLNFVASLRSEFLQTLELVTDPTEREWLTSLFYAQLKCQWTIANLRSGYLAARGRIDSRGICRSGLLAALLGWVEPALSEPMVEAITDFLSQPVHLNRQDPDEVRFLRERLAVLEKTSEERESGLRTAFGTTDIELIRASVEVSAQTADLLAALDRGLADMERFIGSPA
ncbi:MAG: hypothetical protein SFU56_01960 [Capsulimonadales bacterium]|nr:hypothetical protein [Capsulimonadales bacterium]